MVDLTSYEAARDWLYTLKNRGSKYGIDRMLRLVEELGHPECAYPCIHVAGTNGKGSTCAMLEQAFRDQGFRVGLSTSPHLVRQGERIQVDREILGEQEIFEFIKELRLVATKIAVEDPALHPSFFEFMTAMAFLRFKQAEVDLAIVEVGLGGRLDATNALTPEVSVITSIGLDHCEILGDSLAAIAREKGGIIKPGVPVVAGLLPEEAMREIRSLCVQRGCVLHELADRFGSNVDSYPQTNLKGGYQRINAALATLVLEVVANRFKIDPSKSPASLCRVSWPARWEERQLANRKIVFDVSHNSEGAKWLDLNLKRLVADSGGAAPDVVMGVMGAYRAAYLVPVVARWARSIVFVVPRQDRALSSVALEKYLPNGFSGKVSHGKIEKIFPSKGICSLDVDTPHPLVVTGSIYLIGEVWDRYLEESPLGQGDLQDF